MASDVHRFMHENKIGSATLGGHGFGARLALLTGCYHSDYVTGFFGFDYSPMEYKNFDFIKQYRETLKAINEMDLS